MVNKAVKPDESIRNMPQIQRIRELMYWEMDNLARSEWINLVSSMSTNQQEQLARYAFDNKWADLSVQATITAKLWDHLEERFPLAWEKQFDNYTRSKMIQKLCNGDRSPRKCMESTSAIACGCDGLNAVNACDRKTYGAKARDQRLCKCRAIDQPGDEY